MVYSCDVRGVKTEVWMSASIVGPSQVNAGERQKSEQNEKSSSRLTSMPFLLLQNKVPRGCSIQVPHNTRLTSAKCVSIKNPKCS